MKNIKINFSNKGSDAENRRKSISRDKEGVKYLKWALTNYGHFIRVATRVTLS